MTSAARKVPTRREWTSTAVCRRATAKRPPRGHGGWTSRRRQPQGLPRGHQGTFRCAPECDNEEAAPRATKVGRREDVTREGLPRGRIERSGGKRIFENKRIGVGSCASGETSATRAVRVWRLEGSENQGKSAPGRQVTTQGAKRHEGVGRRLTRGNLPRKTSRQDQTT